MGGWALQAAVQEDGACTPLRLLSRLWPMLCRPRRQEGHGRAELRRDRRRAGPRRARRQLVGPATRACSLPAQPPTPLPSLPVLLLPPRLPLAQQRALRPRVPASCMPVRPCSPHYVFSPLASHPPPPVCHTCPPLTLWLTPRTPRFVAAPRPAVRMPRVLSTLPPAVGLASLELSLRMRARATCIDSLASSRKYVRPPHANRALVAAGLYSVARRPPWTR